MSERKLRILWVCCHLVHRYEEVPLLLEAGAEVIPILGTRKDGQEFEPQYDDEFDPLYPAWRASCTLPVWVAERIRRINLQQPTAEEAAFINEWIDVIMIASYIQLVERTVQWFRGKIVYRVFGDTVPYGLVGKYHNVDFNIIGQYSDYYWSPILKALSREEDVRLARNELYLPAFVTPERLPWRWQEQDSARLVSTAVSYIDKSEFYRNKYLMFREAFRGLDYVVLGKNDKTSVHCSDSFIAGFLPFELMMGRLCNTRIFCYGGAMVPTHVHYTPIEAIAMGVPVLFHENCGLAHEALLNGISEDVLRWSGMCIDYRQMAIIAKARIDDLAFLRELALYQRKLLLPLFTRERTMQFARSMIRHLKA